MLLALVILMTALTPLTAAHADHMGTLGWWVYPPVVQSDGQFTANVQDAAYYWQDRGFNGYYPPLPQGSAGSCMTPPEGVIRVCTVDRGTLAYWTCVWNSPDCGHPLDGITNVTHYGGYPNYIYSVSILVASDLSPYRRQQIWRHEFGHALGLGHTLDPSCVMRKDANVPLGTVCYHDASSMGNLYPGPTW